MKKLQRSSDFKPLRNEANFGPPIQVEVRGGVHIAPEVIAARGTKFFATRWPNGLPRHDDPPDTLRFPHGLMLFGESIEQCARRLVKAQLGMRVTGVRVLDVDSYLDDMNHWHIEPLVVATVAGKPAVPAKASEVIAFSMDDLPPMTYWPRKELRRILGSLL